MIPPSISSDAGTDGPDSGAGGQEQGAGVALTALVGRLAQEFSADPPTLASVGAVFVAVRERAPDLFVDAPGALGPAFAALVDSGDEDPHRVLTALGEWALDAEGEPIERMRRDCLRFQSAMTRGVLRLYDGDPGRCSDALVALQRFAFLQVARVEQVDRLLGLQRGEAFMLRVTRRMREGVLRKQDQLGRVSRDQFACLLPRIAGEGVAILAANKILEALEAPIPIGDRAFAPDAVVGIALFPDHGADPQTLVRNSKLAAAIARTTVERVTTYEPAHGETEERNMQYQTRLRHAIEQDALRVAFVPQLDLATGRILGLECALCWTDDVLGEVPEERIIEAAESAGLVREVTWWLFNNALRLCGEFALAGFEPSVGLKVTGTGLAQPDFAEFVGRAVSTWKIAPGRLIVEIHETALAGDIVAVKDTLDRLKALGLRLGIDGLGTGASSLSNLAQLPLDEVRIGAAFVADMRHVPFHAKVVRSLAHLAQDLGLRVTADGVGDADAALALSTLGCDRVQGDYVGRPLAAHEVLRSGIDSDGPAQLPIG